MDPREIAAEVLGGDPAALHAERIKGGLTNESWRVSSAREAVVVRFSTADEQALQLNRASERQALELAEASGIGAPVLLCAPERRLLVTRWVPGHTPSSEEVRTPAMIDRLAQTLKRLHAISTTSRANTPTTARANAPTTARANVLSPVPGERQREGSPATRQEQSPLPRPLSRDGRGEYIQRIDLTAALQGYWRTLDLHGNSGGESSERRRAITIAAESTRECKPCLCHNDVHHLNVIDTGSGLCLLDWEYAGFGDPYFDLASVCCYHAYDAALRTQLLTAYCGDGGNPARLERMCWLFDYIKNLWLEVREASASLIETSVEQHDSQIDAAADLG